MVTFLGTGDVDTEELLRTQYGVVRVRREGCSRGPTLITLHDVGLDYVSNFQVETFRKILTTFSLKFSRYFSL